MKIQISNPEYKATPVPQWMLSLSDLLSLILAFFVLIFATSNPTIHDSKYDKDKPTEISATTENIPTSIGFEQTDQDISTNYLYKIIQDKISGDRELSHLKFSARGESLVISTSPNEFSNIAPKLSRLLGVIQNDIWIYSQSLNMSYDAVQKLQKSGLNKNITFAQSSSSKGQIDIVILP
jgi:hypothetical protein